MNERLDAIEANTHSSIRHANALVSSAAAALTRQENQTDEVLYLLDLARKQQAALDAVRELADYWERTPALRRGTSGAAIREVLEGE